MEIKPGSGMNIPDHFPKTLTVFRVKNTLFFDADPDPGSRIYLTLDLGSGIELFGSGLPWIRNTEKNLVDLIQIL
jgi:hypothetical protein